MNPQHLTPSTSPMNPQHLTPSTSATGQLRSPAVVMEPRRLGALQPNRLSAARTFFAKMDREHWKIQLASVELDPKGNGTLIYRIATGNGVLTFVAFTSEPSMVNRTPRIIGSSWDMVGALLEGEADQERIEQSRQELPKLYAGRAAQDTLVWFRANQSLRLFQHVRECLAAGQQPEVDRVREVGYLMRNTGLDGNGTFGTKDFRAYGPDHPLAVPYHAQMLTAYMMRELAVDLVENLAALDSASAVRLSPDIKRELAVGNGSALGLVMFALNRPHLVGTWISLFERALSTALDLELGAGDPRWDRLESLLARTVEYRAQDFSEYEVFPSGRQQSNELKTILTLVRAARRRVNAGGASEPLRLISEQLSGRVLPEAEEAFNAIVLELIPEECDRLVSELLVDETKVVEPAATAADVVDLINTTYAWTLDFPFNDREHRDQQWYKSRSSEEPRSGPRHEIPEGSFELAIDVPVETQKLAAALARVPGNLRIGEFLLERPELENIVAHLQSLRHQPYAIPRADIRDRTFVPAYIIHLLNGFCFGLDKTVDKLQRNLRGLIFENAPFREDLGLATGSDWWWTPPRNQASNASIGLPVKARA